MMDMATGRYSQLVDSCRWSLHSIKASKSLIATLVSVNIVQNS